MNKRNKWTAGLLAAVLAFALAVPAGAAPAEEPLPPPIPAVPVAPAPDVPMPQPSLPDPTPVEPDPVPMPEPPAGNMSQVALDGGAGRTGESNLGDLLCDAIYWQAWQLNAQPHLALLDAGSLCAGTVPAGELNAQAYEAMVPRDQPLTLVTVSGADLLEALESATREAPQPSISFPQTANMTFVLNTAVSFAGKATYPHSDALKPSAIRRVIPQTIAWNAFDPEAIYTVVTTEAISRGVGAYGAFRGREVQDLGLSLRESVENYVTTALAGTVTREMYGQPLARAQTISYRDVTADQWYAPAVCYVTLADIMKGSGSSFRPDETLNRAMMVTVLHRMMGSPAPASGQNPFRDVPDDAWYTNAVLWAAETKITGGTGPKTFSPDAPLTREQLATFFYRFAAYEGDEALTEKTDHLKDFADAGKISPFAKEAMNWAVGSGLLSGTGPKTLSPQGTATRAQAAVILTRYAADAGL